MQLSGIYYQTAPVGARSKLIAAFQSAGQFITRQPLWGRDQNYLCGHAGIEQALPDSPCGGEIKTCGRFAGITSFYYQTAPVGARSKLGSCGECGLLVITRQPLWGRDQNSTLRTVTTSTSLPDSPCGGEIKTSPASSCCHARHYQTAPVGARSKRQPPGRSRGRCITRQPLWGRDQNASKNSKTVAVELPDSPCGGEIKTCCVCESRNPANYLIAPVGARSKHAELVHQRATWIT